MAHGFDDILPKFAVVKGIVLHTFSRWRDTSHRTPMLLYVIKNDENGAITLPDLIDFYPLHDHATYSQTGYSAHLWLAVMHLCM